VFAPCRPTCQLSCINSEDTNSAHHQLDSLQSTVVSDDVQIVITRAYLLFLTSQRGDSHPVDIRAEDVTVGLGRIPVGFYVRVEFPGGTSRQTKNKAAPVHDRVIQWDDRIHLCGTLELSLWFICVDNYLGHLIRPLWSDWLFVHLSNLLRCWEEENPSAHWT